MSVIDKISAQKSLIGWIVSLLIHGGFAALIFWLPYDISASNQVPIEIDIKKTNPPLPSKTEKESASEKQLKQKPVRAVKKELPHKHPPPLGDLNAKEPPKEDTGPKTFGIEMSSTTTVSSGQGVQIPSGQSLQVSPSVKRIGKGSPQGFKQNYAKGELAPVAVATSMPKVLTRIVPTYPDRMKELGIEGRVVLELTIDGNGRVINVSIIRSLHKELDESAKQAAWKMRFTPAKVNGTAVSMKIPYTFTFVLD